MKLMSFDELLDELRRVIREKGRMSLGDLVEWGKSRGAGALTLLLLVEELKDRGEVETSSETEVVDTALDIALPIEIRAKRGVPEKAEPERAKTEGKAEEGGLLLLKPVRETKHKGKRRHERSRRRRSHGVKGSSILAFLSSEELKEPVADKEVEGPKVEEEQELKGGTEEVGAPMLEELEGDLAIAVNYLSTYWSVGEIRFLMDLKKLGVKDPAQVLSELLRRGLATRSPLGVINATEIIRKLGAGKIRISDLLSS